MRAQMTYASGDCPFTTEYYRTLVDAIVPTSGWAGKAIASKTLKPTATYTDCEAECIKSGEAAYAKGKLGCTAYTYGVNTKNNRPTCILFERPTMQCNDATAPATDPGCVPTLQNVASKILVWVPPQPTVIPPPPPI